MSKYVIANIGGDDSGEDYEQFLEFDHASELEEGDLVSVLGGFCLLMNCSQVDDEYLDEVEWEKVSNILEDMTCDDSMWYGGEGKEEFIKKYGEMQGLRWGVEYDDNCSVLLSGNWRELREEVVKEFERLDEEQNDF